MNLKSLQNLISEKSVKNIDLKHVDLVGNALPAVSFSFEGALSELRQDHQYLNRKWRVQ